LGDIQNLHALAFSSDETCLLAGGDEAGKDRSFIIREWDLGKKKLRAKYLTKNSAQVQHLAYSPDGRYIAVGDFHGDVRVLTRDGNQINAFRHFAEHDTRIHSLGFLDADHIFSIAHHNIGHTWNIHTNRTSTHLFPARFGIIHAAGMTSSKKHFAWCEAFSLTVSTDKLRRVCARFELPLEHNITLIALSDDGAQLLAVAGQRTFYLYDVAQQKLRKKWQGDSATTYAILALRNQQGFVTANREGRIQLWSLDGHLLAELRRYESAITALAVARDNSVLATAGERQRVVLWDLKSVIGRKE
jgi:WD40 repeat protein